MQVFTAEQVTKLFVTLGEQLESRARDESDYSASKAMAAIANELQHGMDWEWEVKQLREDT